MRLYACLVLLALGVWWAVDCWVWPMGWCWKCRGAGWVLNWLGRRRACRSCRGGRKTIRRTVRMHAAARVLAQASKREH